MAARTFACPALALLTVSIVCVDSSRADSHEARVHVPASERYERGSVHRSVFGSGYRDLWRAEVDLPVLDLATEGRGLTPTRRFGGQQTAVLAFEGRDGRSYTFRSTDKDPSAILDPELRDTIVEAVVQDQMAAQHPGAPLVSAVVSEAAGVLTIRERMVVMPDDPRLGDFREEFAGMVGTFFEYPTPASDAHGGFHGATAIVNAEKLYARLAAGHDDDVDVEAFLRARLLDLLLGDFDRHRGQWRWARLPGASSWRPIPEDRDMAFVLYDGAAPRVTSIYVPILQRFGPDYPWIKGLTLHGWEQDRWLLARLSWSKWKEIARDMRARITDDVIERAIAALPPEYAEIDGGRLRRGLRGRRDALLEGARSFYLHLAGEVDIQASDLAEDVTVERADDGKTTVEVRRHVGGPEPVLVYRRTFVPEHTREVRLYLRGGDDWVAVTGPPGAIQLRVVAGSGDKIIDDSRGGGTYAYDARDSVKVMRGAGTFVESRDYVAPRSSRGFVDSEDIPPRDWGFDLVPFPVFGFETDVGALVGAGAIYTRYGFRKHPWSSRHRLSAGWATDAERPRIHYTGKFRPESSQVLTELDLRYSGIEVLHFYGFGNETRDDAPSSFFRVVNEEFRASPSLSLPLLDNKLRFGGGPWLQYSRTNSGDHLIDALDPYGSGGFGSVGATASVQLDTRESRVKHSNLALGFHDNDAAGYPTRGALVEVVGEISPPLWDVERMWGSVAGSVASFVSAGDNARATLALRAGGKRTVGRVPYYAAAYIGGGGLSGGSSAVRGYGAQRFGGDASLFGNADLRVFVARRKLVVPGDFGVVGFADVGRVFLDGERSRRWHPGWGGGVWFAPLTRANTVSFTVADSSEDTLLYLRAGFHY